LHLKFVKEIISDIKEDFDLWAYFPVSNDEEERIKEYKEKLKALLTKTEEIINKLKY